MGPSLFSDGELAVLRLLHGGEGGASMGPSLFSDGELGDVELHARVGVAASMGPSLFSDGEARVWRVVSFFGVSLQWGRRCSATERSCHHTAPGRTWPSL